MKKLLLLLVLLTSSSFAADGIVLKNLTFHSLYFTYHICNTFSKADCPITRNLTLTSQQSNSRDPIIAEHNKIVYVSNVVDLDTNKTYQYGLTRCFRVGPVGKLGFVYTDPNKLVCGTMAN